MKQITEYDKIKYRFKIIKNVVSTLIVLLTIAVCVITTIGLIYNSETYQKFPFNNTNYYYTEEYLSLNSHEKALEIIYRNGESDDNNIWEIGKYDCPDSNFNSNYTFGYVKHDRYADDYFVIGKYMINDEIEMSIQVFIYDKITLNYEFGIMGKSDGKTVLIAMGKLNAPTFNSNTKISFTTYSYNIINSSQYKDFWLSFTDYSIVDTIETVNEIVKEYNFSLSELGFYEFT